MVDLLPDTWQARDLPFLIEAVRGVDNGEIVRTEELADRAGLTPEDGQRAAAALHGAGYVEGVGVEEASYPLYITAVSSKARQLSGTWPSEDVGADRLAAALDALIERTSDGEQRSRLLRLREGLASAGRDVAVSMAAAVLGAQVT